MIYGKEEGGTLQRTITVTIKLTPTEIVDAIWNLDTSEQIMLLDCLKRKMDLMKYLQKSLMKKKHSLNT